MYDTCLGEGWSETNFYLELHWGDVEKNICYLRVVWDKVAGSKIYGVTSPVLSFKIL